MTTRLDHLRARIEQEGLDAILVSEAENRRYVSGFAGSAGYLLVSQHDAVLATDFRYVEQAGNQAPLFRVFRIAGGMEWFPQQLGEMHVRKVGFESTDMTVAQLERFTKALEDIPASDRPQMTPTQGIVEELRVVKDAEELKVLQQAIDFGDAAFERVFATLRPGVTERQVAWDLERTMRELGADSTSFDIIVGSGPNAALPHHRPGERELRTGEPIVIDMGARYQGYCSDLTRTVCLGPADEMFRRIYDIVLQAQTNAMTNAKQGLSGADVDGMARSVIEEAGYSEAFGHGLGHGVGLAVHEHPRVAPRAPDVLENGMVFTIEPGIYLSGWGGVRIEDMVVLENGVPRCLTHAHKRQEASES